MRTGGRWCVGRLLPLPYRKRLLKLVQSKLSGGNLLLNQRERSKLQLLLREGPQMPSENLSQDLIPQMMDAGQKGAGSDPAVFAPSAANLHADADVAVLVQQLAEGARQNAAGAAAAASSSAASWSDARPLLEQLGAYPATFFLAATFVVVSVAVLDEAVVLVLRLSLQDSPQQQLRQLCLLLRDETEACAIPSAP